MQKSLIFGKFACRCPIKGSRLPQDMTETHSQNRRLGYARVSTYGQTLDAVGISTIRRATRAAGQWMNPQEERHGHAFCCHDGRRPYDGRRSACHDGGVPADRSGVCVPGGSALGS
jgi:hypothetical protein